MIEAVDARGHVTRLERPPRRIVSLVPSQTELLASLGLDEVVMGLTRFCVRPEGWKDVKRIVGGTKNVRTDRVRALAPDLVLANYEENTREVVEALDKWVPVFVTEVSTVPEAVTMIRTVGRLVGRPDGAAALADAIDAAFASMDSYEPLRAAYFIWRAPYMTVGNDTFIHDVMVRAGLINVFGDRTRYPAISPDAIAAARPDVLLLASEPFPFQEKHVAEFRQFMPEVPVHLVDGQLFSWYGPRLLETPAYLERLRDKLDSRLG